MGGVDVMGTLPMEMMSVFSALVRESNSPAHSAKTPQGLRFPSNH